MQTLCPSIRWNHISLAGFLERRNNIFLCCGIALVVYSGLGIYSSGRGSVQGDTCGRHAGCAGVEVECEGCCQALLYAGPQCGVMRDWLHYSLWGSHSQQHLLWPYQHPLTPVWQFHSCDVTLGADGFVSASTLLPTVSEIFSLTSTLHFIFTSTLTSILSSAEVLNRSLANPFLHVYTHSVGKRDVKKISNTIRIHLQEAQGTGYPEDPWNVEHFTLWTRRGIPLS